MAMVTIHYTYDPLGRLTAADYSTGRYDHYAVDAVGNRLAETTNLREVNSTYDDANQLASVGGAAYTWDDIGNLTSDGTNSYAFDHANRLSSVTQGGNTYTYSYNGLGNRVSQAVNGGDAGAVWTRPGGEVGAGALRWQLLLAVWK
jgi:YD repeat-containing protein